MTDRPSNSGDSTEPPRPKSIPDDFIWDEEIQGWYPPGEGSMFDWDEWQREFDELLKTLGPGPYGTISRDELLAAGALKSSSKTLRVERDLFSGLFSEEDLAGEKDAIVDDDEDCEQTGTGSK